jgi:pimeloyl-ACP methyl ester carboxylesterase
MPVLIFHGRRDQSVPPSTVERFARVQPRAELHLLDDGHQLIESLDLIWRRTSESLLPSGA